MIIVDAGDERALAPLYAGGWDAPREVRDRVSAILDDVRDARRRGRRRADAALRSSRGDARRACGGTFRRASTRADSFPSRSPPDSNWRANGSPTITRGRSRTPIRYRTPDMTRVRVSRRPAAQHRRVRAGRQRLAAVDRADDGRTGQGRGRRPRGRDDAAAARRLDQSGDPLRLQFVRASTNSTRSAARRRSARWPSAPRRSRAVDKIVGPGNVYVTEAKRQVFGVCGIDGLAGPSEVLVVCDARSRPDFVAGELIAQAEHDPLARVAAVSRDRAMLDAVAALLERRLRARDRPQRDRRTRAGRANVADPRRERRGGARR